MFVTNNRVNVYAQAVWVLLFINTHHEVGVKSGGSVHVRLSSALPSILLSDVRIHTAVLHRAQSSQHPGLFQVIMEPKESQLECDDHWSMVDSADKKRVVSADSLHEPKGG